MNTPLTNTESKSRACTRCKGAGILIKPSGSWAEASECACSKTCLVCKGTHYLFSTDDLGRETAEMCLCERRRGQVRMYNEAHVPGKYADAVLSENYRDKYNNEAFSTFKLLAEEYQRGQKGLLIMGPSGVGKTFLVAAFIHELIFRHSIPVLFQDFFHLLANLRSGYSEGRPESDLIEPLVGIEILVVDELGKGRNTPWEQNILDVIISQRYNNQKTTIFTSNYTLSKKTTLAERVRPKEGADNETELHDTLQERVGSRIFSRLQEMCDFILMKGPDRREVNLKSSHHS